MRPVRSARPSCPTWLGPWHSSEICWQTIVDFSRRKNGAERMNAGRKRAIVIGGSMSGLFAGLLLRRAGFDVDIYERVESELAGRGAGIVAQPVVARTLRELGIDTAEL